MDTMEVAENGAPGTPTAASKESANNSPTPSATSANSSPAGLSKVVSFSNGDSVEDVHKKLKQLQDENAALRVRLEKGIPGRHASVRRSGSIAMKVALFSQGRPVQASEVETGSENPERPESPVPIDEALARLDSLLTVGQGAKAVEVEVAVLNSVVRNFQQTTQQKNDVTSPPTLLKPSAWAERERKYKRDLEEFETTIIEQRLQIQELNTELQQYRDGAQIRPLEQRIQDLEGQLKNSAAANTDLQSRLHDLTLKHRNLIETSPAMAAMWREVLVEQSDKKASALKQHQTAMLAMGSAPAGSLQDGTFDEALLDNIVPENLRSVQDGKNLFENPDSAVPMPPAQPGSATKRAVPGATASGSAADAVAADAVSSPTAAAEEEPAPQPQRSRWSLWSGGSNSSAPPPVSPAPAAERRAPADDGDDATPAAQAGGAGDNGEVSALRAVNEELAQQLDLYQQMVSRLREALEAADLDRAALEAQRQQLMQQVASTTAAAAAAGVPLNATAGSAAPGSAGESRWKNWFRATKKSTDRSSEPGGDGLWQSIENSSLEAMHAQEGGEVINSDAGEKLRDVVLDTMAAKLRAAPAVQEVLDAMREEVKTLREDRKTLKAETAQLGHQLAETKLELAMAAEEALVFRRNLARAMEKESTLELKVNTLQEIITTCLPPSPAPSSASSGLRMLATSMSFRSSSPANPPSPMSSSSPKLPTSVSVPSPLPPVADEPEGAEEDVASKVVQAAPQESKPAAEQASTEAEEHELENGDAAASKEAEEEVKEKVEELKAEADETMGDGVVKVEGEQNVEAEVAGSPEEGAKESPKEEGATAQDEKDASAGSK